MDAYLLIILILNMHFKASCAQNSNKPIFRFFHYEINTEWMGSAYEYMLIKFPRIASSIFGTYRPLIKNNDMYE